MSGEGKRKHSGFSLYLNPARSAIEAEIQECIEKLGSTKQAYLRDLLILGYLASKQGMRADPLTKSFIVYISAQAHPEKAMPVPSGEGESHAGGETPRGEQKGGTMTLQPAQTLEGDPAAGDPGVASGSGSGVKKKFRNLM